MFIFYRYFQNQFPLSTRYFNLTNSESHVNFPFKSILKTGLQVIFPMLLHQQECSKVLVYKLQWPYDIVRSAIYIMCIYIYIYIAEVYLEPSQTPWKFCTKIVNCFVPLTIFAKSVHQRCLIGSQIRFYIASKMMN